MTAWFGLDARARLLISVVAVAFVVAGCAPAMPGMLILHAAPAGTGNACSRARPCSLAAAQQVVRHKLAAASTGTPGIKVEMAGGIYRLAAPLRFDSRDSGRAARPVIWAAAPATHPVISGGFRAHGWIDSDPVHGIWSTRVPVGTATRQLYVAGTAAIPASISPARLGLDLSHWNATGFVITGTTQKYFSDLTARIGPKRVKQLQMLWSPMPPTDWEASGCPVAAIGAGVIRMAQPCWRNLTQRPATIWGAGNNNVNPYALKPGAAPTAIVGARAFLTQPGEWYLDTVTNTLYYKPKPRQDTARIDVEVPRLQTLLEVAGTLAHPVHDLVFTGLTFTTTTWTQPSTRVGFVQIQANLHITAASNQGECTFTTPAGSCPWGAFAQPPGALELVAAHHVTLRDDMLADLGAVGVEVRYGSDDNLIQGNTFTQIASSAVWLGCSGDPDPLDPKADPAAAIIALCAANPDSAGSDARLAGSNAEIMTGNTVDNNVIHHVGYGYPGAAAVTLLFTRHTTISHNDIFDVPYDGLTSGAWQGHPDNIAIGPTHSANVTGNINRDNAIVDNYFHANMQVFVGDGGNIYTEGHQGPTLRRPDGSIDTAASWAHGLVIRGNFFNADPPHNYAYTIAPDVGSQWLDAEGNVMWGAKYSFSCHWPTDQHSALRFTGNWNAAPDDSHCATHFGNTALPARPGPAAVPLGVLACAGVQGRFQALEATLPPRVDYSGVSPAAGRTPARMLVTGSGFTRATRVAIGGAPSPHVQFVSPGVLVADLPAGVAAARATASVRRASGVATTSATAPQCRAANPTAGNARPPRVVPGSTGSPQTGPLR